MSQHGNRIYAVIARISDTLADGRVGPLWHRAEVDGWDLRLTSGDDGTVILSGRKGEGEAREIRGWDCTRYDDWSDPSPVYVGTTMASLGTFADLAERAEWEDRFAAEVR